MRPADLYRLVGVDCPRFDSKIVEGNRDAFGTYSNRPPASQDMTIQAALTKRLSATSIAIPVHWKPHLWEALKLNFLICRAASRRVMV
jgi:hypothetical protein